MHIGIDASRANRQHRTGTEWYSFHVIQELKKIIPGDQRVVLYTKEELRDDLAELPSNWSSKVLRWSPGLLWTQLRLSWEMLWHAPDVLYIPAHTIPLVHPKKIVLVVHDVGFARTNDLYDPKQIGYGSSVSKRIIDFAVRLITLGRYGASEGDYHRFSMNMAKAHASVILTVSNFSRDEILEVYPDISAEKVLVAHNGFHEREESAQFSDEVLRRLMINRPFVFYMGRLEEKKNIPRLIRAWAKARPSGYQLVLGGTSGFGADRIEDEIVKAGLEDSVVRTGWLEDEDATVLLKEATLFVLPSLYEGFGIPVLEAMAAGTPVICSDIVPLHEVAGEAAAFFDPLDEGSMAEVIKRVLNSVEEKESLVKAGFERIPLFSWTKTAQSTWQAICSVQ
ncbi:MAG: hypothetical protein CO132_04765 [Candidatus Kerfeldbacteria bacterium CG_4_9_14_3_um_filter_45_8]|nr:MAG: hypothetical protein CO132_04765 [Candidatus Kerfeldbacteria bacterium CG_4_9_14_3_um_filter_45_8]